MVIYTAKTKNLVTRRGKSIFENQSPIENLQRFIANKKKRIKEIKEDVN